MIVKTAPLPIQLEAAPFAFLLYGHGMGLSGSRANATAPGE
jgi:hypothetical protein